MKAKDIKVGHRYLYEGWFNNFYHVYVLEVGENRSLCRWGVDSDFGGKYTKIGWRSNYRLRKDVA